MIPRAISKELTSKQKWKINRTCAARELSVTHDSNVRNTEQKINNCRLYEPRYLEMGGGGVGGVGWGGGLIVCVREGFVR